MDNVMFNVNGESDELLKKTIELALEVLDQKARAWKIDNKRGLILAWSDSDEGFTKFPFPLDAEGVYNMARQYLNEVDTEEVEFEGWEEDIDTDGYTNLGWRVYTERWGRINKDLSDPSKAGYVDQYDYSFLAIKPCYGWHGK